MNFVSHVTEIKQKLHPIIANFERNCRVLNETLAAVWYTQLTRPNIEYLAQLLFAPMNIIEQELNTDV